MMLQCSLKKHFLTSLKGIRQSLEKQKIGKKKCATPLLSRREIEKFSSNEYLLKRASYWMSAMDFFQNILCKKK